MSLFLKDNVNIELAEGAVLSAYTDRTRFPVFQGMIQSYDEQGEYNLGTWEGNPLPMLTGIITGVNVKEAVIYGQGIIDGNAGTGEGTGGMSQGDTHGLPPQDDFPWRGAGR